MNKARRLAITKIIEELSTLKDRLEEIQTEEQDYFDNMPEGLQNSEKGEAADQAAQELAQAADGIGTVVYSLEELAS